MVKPKKASQKRKAAPSDSSLSFLSKLQLLRDFVGDSFSESDLSSCLRQCGLNTETAAYLLMSGEYETRPQKPRNSSFFAATATATTKSTAASSTNYTPANKRHRTKPAVVSNVKMSPTACSEKKKASLVRNQPSPAAARNDAIGQKRAHFWLCQRWIVGLSNTKNGRCRYQEPMELKHSLSGPAMVRFRGGGIEGTLPTIVGAMLTPLLRHDIPLLSLEAHALMEESGVPIGGDVPLSLRVSMEDPNAFFGLFETNDGPADCEASQFFGSKSSKAQRGRPRRRRPLSLPIAEAAFALLQWAQYGDCPNFEPPPPSSAEASPTIQEESESDDVDDGDVAVLEENEFEAEEADSDRRDKKETAQWAENVVEETASGEEMKEIPEASDPDGFAAEVVLRAYQRQALHWLLQRESGHDEREELERELILLSELSRESPRPALIEPTKKDVDCGEVGPVRVSESVALKSCTIDGVQNPVNHPLWERRFLASSNMETAVSFYVNELLGVASSRPPNPPRHCRGGILADAMGLGKSVMLLALIMKDKESSGNRMNNCEDSDVGVSIGDNCDSSEEEKFPALKETGTTLVVAPLSLVSQWEEEVVTKTNLKLRVHYAETAKRAIHCDSFKGVDVVVTTYGTIQGELLALKKSGSTKVKGLLSYKWHRVILDESHCIKNPLSAVSRACCMIDAERRWCVTGTPIQNSLQDVYALLKFLRHEPWCETGFWKAAITNAATADNDEGNTKSSQTEDSEGSQSESGLNHASNLALCRVKRLLAPLILRRTKDTLNKNGEPILTLPPTEVVTVSVELTAPEREFYTALLQKSQYVFEGFIRSGTASKSWFTIFSLLNRLRQTCDHVALTVKSQLDETEWNPEALQASDSPAKKRAERSSPAKRKKTATDNDSLGTEFLEGLLEKFRTHQKENDDTGYASHVAHALAKTINSTADTMEDECPICLDRPPIDETVITPCAHIFCRDCLVGILKKNAAARQQTSQQCPDGTCPSCNEEIDAKRIIALFKSSDDNRVTTSYLVSPEKAIKNEQTQLSSHVAARQTLEKALRGSRSSKLTAVINELHAVWELDPRSKVLIFSQYLGFLDLLQAAMRKDGIPSGRLDGKLSLKERVAVLEKFKQADAAPVQTDDERSNRIGSVLLMSMKAGGIGINVTCASSVFVVDPWWNESVEDQCVGRIHRIGQTAKVVRVRKFCVSDSVEERIVLLQRRKKDMACKVLSDINNDGALSSSTPTLDDFKILFGG